MDLLLGVTDLHGDEAVVMMEDAMSGVTPPSLPVTSDTSFDTGSDSSGEKEASSGSVKKHKRNKRLKIVVLDPSSNQR
ncbi:hypothetical protein ZIOFF_028559 [Zingiber officinale]|uniref:Uncharacterized protein n=1 Tax=Zingiber officinale TaxID=94328 RepID=A0A8J5GW45_ZINOF|nr:hypothetical protein ZIOFF_028559 [Zingiber officinale]